MDRHAPPSRPTALGIGLALALSALAACGGGSSSADAGVPDSAGPLPQDSERDVIAMALAVDVSTRLAVATITVAGSDSGAVSLEVGDLSVNRVARDDGNTLRYAVTEGRLDIEVPVTAGDLTFDVEYEYQIHDAFDGALESGVTLLWPYHCGNLFPCRSNPDDGLTVELILTGVPDGEVAVYPESIDVDAPSYMPAWAIGAYTFLDLGQTTAGTKLGVWYLPGGEADATAGTTSLRDAFEWLETTYGAYPFGDTVAAVSVEWGAGALGGMEHHPYWHVADSAMSDPVTQIHEAAHGWYGNGVRIACWEDFVLSEGTVSYLAARGIEQVLGTTVGDNLWVSYRRRADRAAGVDAWPDSCNEIDIIDDGLFSDAPYMKGAHFYKAVEAEVGRAALDAALASFYAENVGKAARMQDMLDHIESETGFDPDACADAWLRQPTIPAEDTCP